MTKNKPRNFSAVEIRGKIIIKNAYHQIATAKC